MRLRSIALLATASVLPAHLSGQQPPQAQAAATTIPVTIDGLLNEAVWSEAQLLSGFTQREPSEGDAVSERTEVRVAYDAEALYVAAWMFDRDPSSIVHGQTLRDATLDNADAFLLVLDTYLDRQNGFVFGTTPAGIEYDGQVAGEGRGTGGSRGRFQGGSAGGFNVNWDGSWEVATSTDGQGWYAEMRIPFSTLRYRGDGSQTWGLNFERRIRRNNEQSVWAPMPRQFNLYRVSVAGTLELEAPSQRIMTVSPYVLGDMFKDYTVASPEFEFGQKVGVDAKIGLSQSLTLDLTINTDFAQAEVDDQQVNLTRFSLFFPEKRPFFLENAGTFQFGAAQSSELFFSRRIGLVRGQEVPIQAGARLTGKVGDFQVGFLDVQTDDLRVRDAESDEVELVSPKNNFGVVRVFREFDNRTQIGGIFVSRINADDTDDYNLAYGIDGRLGIGQNLTLDGWIGLTRTPELDEGVDPAEGEYGFEAKGSYVGPVWETSAGYRQIGEEMNPEVGFLNRRDYRRFNARVLRHVRTDDTPWFREFRPHVSWDQYWTLDGFSEEYKVHIDNHFVFENGALFQLPGLNFTGEGLEEPFEIREGIVIPAGTYDNLDWEFRANTDRSAALSVSGGWSWGGFYSGTRFGPNATLTYRYQDRLSTSLTLNYFDVDLDEGAFTTSVYRFNASYSFTPRLYLQANVQYNDDTENLGSNIRLGWLDTAGTGLFIVWNDTDHRGMFERTGLERGPQQRQLVIKYTKLFQLTR